MFVVKGTSLIPSHQYSVQRFLQSFLFYPYSISTPPSSFSFQSYFLFFNSLILHFYTSTAVDTCSLRLRIFLLRICQFWAPRFENFSWETDPPSLQYLLSFTFRRNPCLGPPTVSKNYQKCVSKFYSTWLANRQWVSSWYTGGGARTRILTQFHIRTKPKFIFVCGTGYPKWRAYL